MKTEFNFEMKTLHPEITLEAAFWTERDLPTHLCFDKKKKYPGSTQ